MFVYKNINKLESKNIEVEKKNELILSRGKLNNLSFLLICFLSFGMLGFSSSLLNLSQEVRQITSSWTPNISDLGKLKFVINQGVETDLEVFSSIDSLAMPFENNYVTEVEDGVFMVNGLGGMIVKSCLDGTVSKVESKEASKTVWISHGKGLTSVYEYIDSVGVKVGDRVKKNTPIGVSTLSVIQFKVLFRDKVVAGLTVKDGEMTFM